MIKPSSEILQMLQSAQNQGKPLVITTTAFTSQTQQDVDEVLLMFLKELGVPFLMDQLSYCIRELAVNAKKANTKRVYFQERGLDMENKPDYEEGMKSFKLDTLANQKHYMEEMKLKGYYIKIELLKWNNVCSVVVKNNSRLLKWEQDRIAEKIEKANLYNSLQDAFAEVLDESEGAGLGILVLILMLKNLGFEGNFFQVYTTANETVAHIVLPLSSETD
jgi:hypothetical protein